MAELIHEPAQLLYRDGTDERIVLDYKDLDANMGAVPLALLSGMAGESVASLVEQVERDGQLLQDQFEGAPPPMGIVLPLCLLFARSLRKYTPLQLLEIGNQHGLFAFLLTRYARKLHAQSCVATLSEDLYDAQFLNMLTMLGDDVAGYSIFTASTHTDLLRSDAFDFVLLNGCEHMDDPHAAVANALRLAAPGARLVCLPRAQAALRDAFAALASPCESFDIGAGETLLSAEVGPQHKRTLLELQRGLPAAQHKARLRELLPLVCDQISALSSPEGVPALLQGLDEIAELVVALFDELEDVSGKNTALVLKDHALDYLYAQSDELRQQRLEQMQSLRAALLSSFAGL